MRDEKGRFVKGHSPNEEFRKKLSEAKKGEKNSFSGKKHSPETKAKMSASHKKMTAETRKKMSLAKKGKPSWNKGKRLSESHKEKLRLAHSNKKLSEEHKEKIRSSLNKLYGNPSDKPKRKSKRLDKLRKGPEYKFWRRSVLERDGHKCVQCGSIENIQADHIKQFAFYPELRFVLDNGRALCAPCHKNTDTYGNSKQAVNLQ